MPYTTPAPAVAATPHVVAQGNRQFHQRIEFTTAVGWYFGPRWYYATLVLFNVSLVLGNLASIVVSAQVRRRPVRRKWLREWSDTVLVPPRARGSQTLDNLIVFVMGRSFAVAYAGSRLHLLAATRTGVDIFGEHDLMLTLGYVLVALSILPLCLANLEENAALQRYTMIGCFIVLAIFGVYFINQPDKVRGGAGLGERGVVNASESFGVRLLRNWAHMARRVAQPTEQRAPPPTSHPTPLTQHSGSTVMPLAQT